MLCDRSIEFIISGGGSAPDVRVEAVEVEGRIRFLVDVLDGPLLTADLRGLFFDLADAERLAGLTIASADPLVTDFAIEAGRVIDLGQGANMRGAVRGGFDIGIEFGQSGIGKGRGDVSGPVAFEIASASHDLTLNDIANVAFGARLTSVGHPDGPRDGSAKLLATAPAAPDAGDDVYQIFEDGAPSLDEASTVPEGVVFQVLANDPDADGDVLKIVDVSVPAHGTVEIIDGDDADDLPGDAILYTPDADFAGEDAFKYCIEDDNGGRDFAAVSVAVAAVADVPGLTWSVRPGENVNQLILEVRADATDLDGSEYIDRIEIAGLGEGATAHADLVARSTGEPGSFAATWVIDLPQGRDSDFDLAITAVSKERANGDEEVASTIVPIELAFERAVFATQFEAVDQSIWATGGEFVFEDDRFLGIDTSWDDLGGGFVFYDTNGRLKAGFQSTLSFEGGEIDATADYDLTVESSWNKATDVLFLTAEAVLGDIGFETQGPQGSYALDFIFDFFASFSAGLDFGDLGKPTLIDVDVGPLATQTTILDIDSDDASFTVDLPAGFSLGFAWPDVDTASGTASGPTATATGTSNNFLELGLDVDDLLAAILGIPNPFSVGFDIGVAWGSAELIDLDLTAGLNFVQSFLLQVGDLAGRVVFEDGSNAIFDFTNGVEIDNASALDADGDGLIAYDLYFAPLATLENDTELGFNLGYDFAALQVSGGYDVGLFSGSFSVGPAYSVGESATVATVDVYENSFDLAFAENQYALMA